MKLINQTISTLILKIIKLYRKIISPLFGPTVFGQRCKYFPSCSEYAEIAIKKSGIKGVLLAAYRIFRCNPWSNGGVDYPPNSVKNRLKIGVS